uniref:ARAD1D10736p n=1 Tax=Blastobotrys adeninivorans TaxID=409370 RepID=A0A060T8E8_BLAAD
MSYPLGRRLGRGLFSEVYECNGKALKLSVLEDERPPHNAKRELDILRALNSKHVIQVIESFTRPSRDDPDETELGFLMPLMNASLESVIARSRKAAFPTGWRNALDVEKAIEIARQLACALDYVHSQGIIHRDLKPENVMFDDLNGDGVLKLIDFGIAWKDNEDEPVDKKILDVGTGAYRCPEVLFGLSDYDQSYDMWAYGCVVAKMFTKDGGDLFGDPSGDLALVAEQFRIVGSPTKDQWPSAAKSSTFKNMSFESLPGLDLGIVIPRAPEKVVQVVKKCLQFEGSFRLRADQIAEILN